ncbi:MAG: preprotein translocase subunit SecE [Candidatus Levybacteria bacterium]|nr:preprotein translocase subunit SecE [Candidatus Levybacteria bacterium]
MMINPITFLLETRDELKKVTWPRQQDIIRLTIVVILISVMIGFFIGALDFIFAKVIETIVK